MIANERISQMQILQSLFEHVPSTFETFRPLLFQALLVSDGPILELGMGDGSTPLLNVVSSYCNRRIHSFEHDEMWAIRFGHLKSRRHRIKHISSYDECPIESALWDVALVDHAPVERRIVDIERLRRYARLIVVHDTESENYGYEPLLSSFRWRKDDTSRVPHTTIVSDSVDVDLVFRNVAVGSRP